MKLLAVLGIAVPAFAQFGGPAILSRGEAPSAMVGPQIEFRPFVEVNGVYNTGLTGVRVDSAGNIANDRAYGVNATVGLSGSHSWRHTILGLSFRGGYTHYTGDSTFDSTDITMNLGVRHQLARHVAISWNNSMGLFKRDAGLLSSISPSVPFDPNQTYVPTTDFFNDRTLFLSSQLGMVVQRSTRMSFSFGGGIFFNDHRASGLYGVLGEDGIADVQYRLTRRLTIGAAYNYGHYGFQRITSNTDFHAGEGTFAYQLSRWWEVSAAAGVVRVESKFIQSVPVDPAVAAIIGITESSQVIYAREYVPTGQIRLSRTFHKGVWYASAGYGITPGNGLFLTSEALNASTGYTYTGLRRWSFGVLGSYYEAKSIGNVTGKYAGEVASAHMSRQLLHSLHLVTSFSAHRYSSRDFNKYNQTVYMASVGLGWSPGDIPLRIW